MSGTVLVTSPRTNDRIRRSSCSRDSAEAGKAFALACRKGHAHGCFNLGAFYYHGRFARKDLPRARRLFRKACDGGAGAGCGNLALMYFRGEGGPKLRKEAIPLFKKGCKGGSKMACKALKTSEVKAARGGAAGAPASTSSGGKAGSKAGKKKSVSFKNVKMKGSCGMGMFAVFGLLGGIQNQLVPCLPGGARATVTVVNTGGKIKNISVAPGGKRGACVKRAVRKLRWPGGKGTCRLTFDVGR